MRFVRLGARADPAEIKTALSKGHDVLKLEGVGTRGCVGFRLCQDLLNQSAILNDVAVAALSMSACCLPSI